MLLQHDRTTRDSPYWHQSAPNKPPHSSIAPMTSYKYGKCLVGGVLASSIRLVTNPLEVIKVYCQIGRYQGTGIAQGLRLLWLEEGVGGIFKGVGPTAIAYAFQTGTKYCLYEYFKDTISSQLDANRNKQYSQAIYVVSAGCAEACADVLMCPWEQLRVKVQTSPQGLFPTRFGPALSTMISNRTHPFAALRALWMRQIPATITNFFVFENTVHGIYQHVLQHPKDAYSKQSQLAVSLVAGYVSGACCAIVSHPADSLVSLMSQPHHEGKSMKQLVKEVGLVKLGTRGLSSRILLTGTIVGMQWILYDSFKTAMGMGTSGSDGTH